jgi:hypothetical protein
MGQPTKGSQPASRKAIRKIQALIRAGNFKAAYLLIARYNPDIRENEAMAMMQLLHDKAHGRKSVVVANNKLIFNFDPGETGLGELG